MSDRPTGPVGLAAERTHLAWRRTALGLTAGAVTAAHLLQEYVGGAAWILAAAGALVAAALAVTSRRRHLGQVPGWDDGRLVALCGGGVLLLGVGGLAFVLMRGV